MTRIPSASETTIVRVSNGKPLLGSVKPRGVEELEQALCEAETEAEADQRGDDPDDEGLHDHRLQDLAPRGSDRPERCKLTRPLGNGDRERVRDHEGAYEERDEAESEQDLLQNARKSVVSLASLEACAVPVFT